MTIFIMHSTIYFDNFKFPLYVIYQFVVYSSVIVVIVTDMITTLFRLEHDVYSFITTQNYGNIEAV